MPAAASSKRIRDSCVRALIVHPGIYADANPLLFPPWGALCVASACRDAGFEAEVADLNGQAIDEVLPQLIQEIGPNVIGITTKLGLGARRTQEAVRVTRAVDPSIRVAAGGPLVATFPNPTNELWQGVDALFAGDGELSFPRWLADGAVPTQHAVRGPEADLDVVGIPNDWSRLADYVKPAGWWPNMDVPAMHVAAGRGCTRRCTFCYLRTQYPDGLFRFVGSERLLLDLDKLNRRLDVRGFYFVDDCFIDRGGDRVRSFCQALQERGSPYRFGCDVQWPDLEKLELLEAMHSAGFRCLYLGLEAASADVRRRLGKGRIHEAPATILQRVLDMGFLIRASVGIGWPGESASDIHATLALIDSVPELLFDAYKYLPLPNLPLTSYWQKHAAPTSLDRTSELAFQDYSEFNSNFSNVPDDSYEELWRELIARRDERAARVFDS
jgi:radical SAM superfamily enzyme YgiQ (UPF0313 family)